MVNLWSAQDLAYRVQAIGRDAHLDPCQRLDGSAQVAQATVSLDGLSHDQA